MTRDDSFAPSILVTGTQGQVSRSLVEAGVARGWRITAIGRPDLDLERPQAIACLLRAHAPDVVVSAAAYTQVDKAESEPERAHAVNGAGAGALAAAAREVGASVIHLSTDYVFDGEKGCSYSEEDQTAPLGVYGASKLAGEAAVAAAHPDHVILRLAWVFSPFGANFVRTMLRLAADRDEVRVVDDQIGRPTSAFDIATALLDIAAELRADPEEAESRGVFHLAPQGSGSWADLAEAVFSSSRRIGGPSSRVARISTAEFPTPAHRPRNSRLDGAKLARVYGVHGRPWTDAVDQCVQRLLAT